MNLFLKEILLDWPGGGAPLAVQDAVSIYARVLKGFAPKARIRETSKN